MRCMGVAALAVIAVALAVGAATVSAPVSHAAATGQEAEQGARSSAALFTCALGWRIFKNETERVAKRFEPLRKAFAQNAGDLVRWASAAADVHEERPGLLQSLKKIIRSADKRVQSTGYSSMGSRDLAALRAIRRAFDNTARYFTAVQEVLTSIRSLASQTGGTYDRKDADHKPTFDRVHKGLLAKVDALRVQAQKLDETLNAANRVLVRSCKQSPPVSPKIIDRLSDPRVPKKGTPLTPLKPVSKALCPSGIKKEGVSVSLQPVGPGETGFGSVGFNCKYRDMRVGEGGKATAVSFRWGDGSQAGRVPFCARWDQAADPWRRSRTHDIQVYVDPTIDGADKLRQTWLKDLADANIALKC